MRITLITALPRWGAGWIEAFLFPVLGLLLAWELSPTDPLLLKQPFPWLLIIPLLIALRYELLPALLSVIILASTFLWHPYPEIRGLEVFAGTVLVILIASEYAGYWTRKEAGRSLQEEITTTRFRQLSDDLYVTRISQDRLEQSLLYHPMSIRSAMLELKKQLAEKKGVLDKDLGESILYFLNQLVGVQVASIFETKKGAANPSLIANFGDVHPWEIHDPVLREAMESAHSQTLANLEITAIDTYISAHVHTSSPGMHFILTVEDMSFFAINKESLQTIEVIFQYLCNYADSQIKAATLLDIWPDCPAEFAIDLMQLQKLAQRIPQVGMFVLYEFHKGPASDQVLEYLGRLRRGLDILWIHDNHEKVNLIALLPFAGNMAAEGHFQRMRAESNIHYRKQWDQCYTSHKVVAVNNRSCESQIRQILEEGIAS
ncbi:hypothetical protein B1757_00210 [Acidithiobacillus marinus]|uniref:PelD GGDEF domain-containing protein n=1 Tax=Acidithiobacillus marinus TaxID=187490 RepID=A0A2I1DQQ0_9PROT|nr:PelD GGDEF domain-containing protein [Acidithiobacillus marinus]PKY12206.1 hypothetical protein B1757_00210 [Acidithiobacillus marinus]